MWRIDSTLDALQDLTAAYNKFAFNPDEEAKKKGKEDFFTNIYPKFLAIMEKRIIDNASKDHIVGDKMTIADFGMAALAFSHVLNANFPNPDSRAPVDKHPVLLKYFEALGDQLKEYLSTRKPSPW